MIIHEIKVPLFFFLMKMYPFLFLDFFHHLSVVLTINPACTNKVIPINIIDQT